MGADLGGVFPEIGDDLRHGPRIFGGDGGGEAAGAAKLRIQRRELGGEAVDFRRTGLNAFEDLFRETGEIRNAGPGDLGSQGEGAQVAHRLLHVTDMAVHLGRRHRQCFETFLASCLP